MLVNWPGHISYDFVCSILCQPQPCLVVYSSSHRITPFQTLIFRGLNPTNMSSAAMLEYLQNWLTISKEVDASSYSLLLHLPIFLAYNQPTNFSLLYSWCTRKGLLQYTLWSLWNFREIYVMVPHHAIKHVYCMVISFFASLSFIS